MFKRLCCSLLLLLLSLAISSAYAKSAKKKTPVVKVGCLFPLTGSGGRYGRDSTVAVDMALEDLKAMEKPGGRKIEVQVRDTRTRILRAVQIARNYIDQDRVRFLCGIVSSGVARAVSKVALSRKTFFIGTDHASPSLTDESLHPYYFRVTNGSRQSMRAGALYIKEHYANKTVPLKIAYVGPDYNYGYQVWRDLRYFLKEAGVSYDVVGELWPRLYETDYTIHIKALMEKKPDIVVNAQWGIDLVTFVKQAKELALFKSTIFMNFDTGGNYEVLSELQGAMPLGVVLSARHHVHWPKTDANTSFVNRFFKLQGRYPTYAAEGAYSGILAIGKIIQSVDDPDDDDQIRSALEQLRIKLPEDPDGFKSWMDPVSHQMMQVQVIGRTVQDHRFPPAKTMLGQLKVYYPPKAWPRELDLRKEVKKPRAVSARKRRSR